MTHTAIVNALFITRSGWRAVAWSASWAAMATSNMRAGGSFVALGTIAGTLIGGLLGQPSLGLLLGFAGGAAIAVLVWLADRGKG